MRLTIMTDYAMRLLMHVGNHPDRLCTISEIAQAHAISEPHLMKVTHRLAQDGWLQTIRGKNGGMRLAKPPREIRLGDVVRCTENDMALVECMGAGSLCSLNGRCRLTGIMQHALAAFLEQLDRHTLADILTAADAQNDNATKDGAPALPLRELGAARQT
ncbi:MAG: Rrf2 family transcriptional regulator [Candidimonas sp.]|jgi:Rrf2 family nitric oxide-sensitive transcriptional repressor